MEKCMNRPEHFVEESLAGLLSAYPHFYQCVPGNSRAVFHPHNGPKVRIVTGGGYGHLPLFLGYVGDGLCDGVAVGNVFTSPSCESILQVTRALNPTPEKGVLYLFGNYFGDSMNFEMARDALLDQGIPAEIVKCSDDAASASRAERAERRGIAGIFFAYKAAGAYAAQGKGLEEVARIAQLAVQETSSFGVAFSSCTLPGRAEAAFELGESELEIGMGIHGEPGIRRGRMLQSHALAEELCKLVIHDLSLTEGERVGVLVNGLGATSREELFVFYRDVAKVLSRHAISAAQVFVGEYATSLEMAGLSLSLIRLTPALEAAISAPAYTPLVCF